MANKNNKGFSLIEIVIAMAVLTLLLTPIIKQFAQTMKVSRQAKEQQYVNEEASYSLEEGQTTPQEIYEAKYIQMVNENPELSFSTSTSVNYCSLVDETGNAVTIADASGNPVKDAAGNVTNNVNYSVDTFTLKNVKLGPDNAVYNRVMTVDNLATEIRGLKNKNTGEGLSIKYNIAKDDVPAGYTLTNEGSAVLLDGSGNVISVVVEDTTYVGNPNDTNLGNMQNLDYQTVAMINGTAANFDEQAEKALFSMAMDSLKKINYEEWELGMLHSQGDNILLQHGYAPVMTKLTKIYVEKFTEPDNKVYYLVKADVVYDCYYSLDGIPVDEQLSYNVFSQKFYMDECPAIYFEYQPFVSEIVDYGNGLYDITYAANDYILIDNYVKDAKLYIYKPVDHAIYAASGSAKQAEYDKKMDSYTYTTVAPDADDLASQTAYEQFLMDNSVAIHVAKAHSDVEDMAIYTNLNTEDNGSKSQFFASASEFTAFNLVNSEKAAYSGFPKQDYDRTLIKPISEDTRYDDRLRTVTVTMIPIKTDNSGNIIYDQSGNEVVRDDANTIILTGPKGEK